MTDQISISQVVAQAEWSDTPNATVSQVVAQAEWTDPPAIKATHVIAQVEYEEAIPSSGVVDVDYKIPIVLATLYLETGTIRRATSYYVDASGNEYLPGLEFPTYSDDLRDLFSGVEQSGSLTLVFELGGQGVSTGVSFADLALTQELRSRWISLYYYDPVTGENTGADIDARVKIDSYEIDDTRITLQTITKDDDIFDKLLPPDVVNSGVFDKSAEDLGKPINLPIGNPRKIPLLSIKNDMINDHYDYLVGYAGITAITQVYRNGKKVPNTEYTWLNDTEYPGYSVIRFSLIQKDFGGNFMTLTADVSGFQWASAGATGLNAVRHIIDAVYLLLVNGHTMSDPYGADLNGVGGFVESVWALEASANPADYEWWIDFNIGGQQRRAGDWLNDILAHTPISIHRQYNSRWGITVDVAKSPSFTVGHNDGFYNDCSVTKRWVTASSQAMKKVTVQYNFSENSEGKEFHYEIFATANNDFGVDKTIQLPAVNDTMTAKKILSRIVNTEKYSNKWVSMECGPSLKTAKKGDVIRVYTDYSAGAYQDYIINSLEKNYSEKFNFTCRTYDSRIYDDLVIADPVLPESAASTVEGPATFVGDYTHADSTVQEVSLTVQEISGYDQCGIFNGVQPSASYVFHKFKAVRPYTLPATLTGSHLWAETAATASTVMTLKKNGTTIGTATFAAAGTVATFSFASAVSFAVGDILYLYGPATADATLKDLGWSFIGVKESTFA